MPSDFALKMMNTMHRGLLTVSGGRIGWTAGSMPVLELTTVGRKTGESRSVLLTSPWQDGDTMALVASRGGVDPDTYGMNQLITSVTDNSGRSVYFSYDANDHITEA